MGGGAGNVIDARLLICAGGANFDEGDPFGRGV